MGVECNLPTRKIRFRSWVVSRVWRNFEIRFRIQNSCVLFLIVFTVNKKKQQWKKKFNGLCQKIIRYFIISDLNLKSGGYGYVTLFFTVENALSQVGQRLVTSGLSFGSLSHILNSITMNELTALTIQRAIHIQIKPNLGKIYNHRQPRPIRPISICFELYLFNVTLRMCIIFTV